MEELSLNDALRAITDRFCVVQPIGLLGHLGPPFDTTKPNQHDNKADFLAEKSAVDEAIAQSTGILDFLSAGFDKDAENHLMAKTLGEYVIKFARDKNRNTPVDSTLALTQKNAADVGLAYVLFFLVSDYHAAMTARKKELSDQEVEFWSGNSRPPNHYARTIALRFARWIASNTGKRPTFGTSRDGGHPSTDYGRALEEVFELLGIKANFRRAAEWAIGQLTDDDLRPSPPAGQNALASLLDYQPLSAEEEVVRMLAPYPKASEN